MTVDIIKIKIAIKLPNFSCLIPQNKNGVAMVSCKITDMNQI
jgi:hypothetical protein